MVSNNLNCCTHCKESFEWTDAQFCPYCGNSLNNYCSNEDCAMSVNDDEYEENQCLSDDFDFCPKCGSETTFHILREKSAGNVALQ